MSGRRPSPVAPGPTDGHWYGRLFARADGPYYRRQLFERLGSDRHSKPANFGLDDRLPDLLGSQPGFFVEAGANDGFAQSNTYHLERRHGWRGVLVEPIPALAERCRYERPTATVVQCALVPPERAGERIAMRYAYLMTIVEGARGSPASDDEHIINAHDWMGVDPYAVEVPGRTLTDVLEEAQAPRDIGFLSLDLEGFEPDALRGLDLDRFAPRFMLVEVFDERERRSAVEAALADHYAAAGLLTPNDALFVRNDLPMPALPLAQARHNTRSVCSSPG